MSWAIVLKFVCVLFLFHTTQAAARGLAANVSTLCASGCLWSDASIWDLGTVPTSADTVDLQATGSFAIRVDVDVSIQDFDIGTDDPSQGTHTLEVSSGVTFTSSGQVNGLLTATITVDANANLISAGASTINGYLIVYGFAQFGIGNPSLNIYTVTLQNPLKFVNARLELRNGTVVAANDVSISAQSSIIGNGVINATLQLEGTFKPGFDGIVGQVSIYGDLSLDSSADIYIDLSSIISFDHVWISGNFIQHGSLHANLINNFEPLSHSEFIAFNHSSQRDGFSTVRGEGLSSLLNNKWQAVVDQQYTALLFDDAATVLISFATIVACLFFTLM